MKTKKSKMKKPVKNKPQRIPTIKKTAKSEKWLVPGQMVFVPGIGYCELVSGVSVKPEKVWKDEITEIGADSINALREAIVSIEEAVKIPWKGAYCTHNETGVQVQFTNSGGRDWLSKEHEQALFNEGFRLVHYCDRLYAAFIPNMNMRQALAAFQNATSFTGSELGCNCCGVPFSFTAYVNGKEDEGYAPSYPTYGDDYEG